MDDSTLVQEQLLRQLAEQRAAASDPHLQPHSLDEAGRLMHELQVHQIELEMQNENLRDAQQTLSVSHNRYSTLYDLAPVGYCTLDHRGLITEANITLSRLLQLERKKLLNFPLARYIHQDDFPQFARHFTSHQQNGELELRIRRGERDYLHTLVTTQRLEQGPGKSFNWLVAISDISRLHQLTLELKVKGAAIENTMEGIIITNADNHICYVNRAFEKTTGYPREQVLGQNPRLLQSGKHDQAFYNQMWQSLRDKGQWKGEIWNRRASGEIFPEWLSLSSIPDLHGKPDHYIGVFSDITTQQEIRQRLHQLAYFDGLTGLPNRHLLHDRLQQLLAAAQRNGTGFALLFMDIDRFKTINDTLGHSVGDQLLIAISERITGLLRDTDTFSRVSGDEFMAVLPDSDHPVDATHVAEKILLAMHPPFNLDGRHYHISMSIGISHYPKDGDNQEQLIKNADIAMYRAKANGRNTYYHYQRSLDERLAADFDLEHDLRHALRRNDLELYFQPLVDITSGDCLGVESLLRWRHRHKGWIAPSDFIRLAEETGLIVEIGQWVLLEACRQYHAWRRQGVEVGFISVNLSPQQFLQTDLAQQLSELLRETAMPADRLIIDITESAAMPNPAYTAHTLAKLRDMGIRIHIDDFGSGFSSLSHLRHFPIDGLKIDSAFISELPSNLDDLAIVRAILAIASALNIQIVAEGIETEAQRECLCQEGCHIGQGYLFARPMSAQELTQWIRTRPPG